MMSWWDYEITYVHIEFGIIKIQQIIFGKNSHYINLFIKCQCFNWNIMLHNLLIILFDILLSKVLLFITHYLPQICKFI